MPASLTLDDASLCRLLGKGDEQAFTTLYRRESPVVYRYALSVGRSPSLADEIVQETFSALIRAPSSYDPERGALQPWLLGVARRLLAKRLSLKARDVPWDPQDVEAAPDLDAFEALAQEERSTALWQAIESLPVEFREAVTLCDLEEISYAEASVILDVPLGTVRSRLHRARALLTRKLGRLRATTARQEAR